MILRIPTISYFVGLLLLGLLIGCSPLADGAGDLDPLVDPAAAAQNASSADLDQATAVEAAPKNSTASDQIPASPSTASIVEAGSRSSRLGDTVVIPGAGVEPQIGEVTFALDIAANSEPIDPGIFFAYGFTEVHAIFDYSGIPAGSTWERVWYLNDQEVARISETWAAPESGVFDYVIDNSGRPLPAGDWLLEIYVDGNLQALGVFVVEDAS